MTIKIEFHQTETIKPLLAQKLEDAVYRRIHESAIVKEHRVRLLALPLMNAGWRMHELCLIERCSQFGLSLIGHQEELSVVPAVSVSSFRLWSRRMLVKLYIRRSPVEIFRILDRDREKLESLLWQK